MEGGFCQGFTAFIMRVGLVVFPFRGGWVGGGEGGSVRVECGVGVWGVRGKIGCGGGKDSVTGAVSGVPSHGLPQPHSLSHR